MTKKEKLAKENKEKSIIKLEKDNEIKMALSDATKQLIEKEKKKLPDILQKRKEDLIKELEKKKIAMVPKNDKGISEVDIFDIKYPYQEVIDNMFKPILKWREKEAQYSPAELWQIFDIFTEMCSEIKKNEETFTPSLDLFLSFADLGLDTFKKYQSKQEYRPTCDKVFAYIGAVISDNAMKKVIDSRTATFLQERDLNKQLMPNVTVIGGQFNSTIPQEQLEEFKKELRERNLGNL